LTATIGGAGELCDDSRVEISTIGVVGLGTMGAGIAQLCVQAGYEAVGREISAELGERGRGTIAHYLGRAVERERMTADERDRALGRLSLTTDLRELARCDLVIEAIVEDLGAKRELFAELDGVVAPEAILATNTSALPVTEIAAATSRPERVLGMHFFNPAPVLRLEPTAPVTRRSRPPSPSRDGWGKRQSPATTRPASSSTGS
jgi:3-hydroxybutyryl-CoA dehydrogenase